MNDTHSRLAIALPSIALMVSWGIFLGAIYSDLFVTPVYDDQGTWIGQDPEVQISPYLFFFAVAVFAAAAVWAQRLAIRERLAHGPHERLPRAAHRFATLSIVIALVVSAVLGISVFLEGFNEWAPRRDDLVLRLLTTYLPIILHTALVVTVLLVAFVFRKDRLPKTDDKALLEEDSVPESEGADRSLGGAYAVPIIAVAIALIVGLVVFDVTGTSLDVWVWVLIQLFIGAGIVAGTILGERAVAAGAGGQTSRSRITRGARWLNFVLSIVFGAVVSLMGFGYGSSAIDNLRISPSFYVEILAAPGAKLQNVEISASGWDLQAGSTVSILLEEPARSLLSGEAGRNGDFYQTAPMPQDLEPGDYVMLGQATSTDGRPLAREVPFAIAEDGEVQWDYYGDPFKFEEQDTRILGPSWGWAVGDLLPALVLLVLAQSGIYLTMTERTKRRNPRAV